MGRLDGKVAIVTGAAMGIGAATATRFAAEGAKVAIVDLDTAKGNEVGNGITAKGGEAKVWSLDVTDEEQVAKVFGGVEAHWGKIDIVVANAGIGGPNQPTHEVSLADWEQTFAVNSTGVFLCTKHAVPAMRRNGGGSIVNISSIYGIIGASDLPPYHASKGAVRCMTKNDALYYASDKIRVNSVHPGYIWTPLVEGLAISGGIDPADLRADLDSRHPLGHVGEPADVAGAILYLASDEAKFVTGSELVIDGGYTAG